MARRQVIIIRTLVGEKIIMQFNSFSPKHCAKIVPNERIALVAKDCEIRACKHRDWSWVIEAALADSIRIFAEDAN